eukprot:gene22190-32726_t
MVRCDGAGGHDGWDGGLSDRVADDGGPAPAGRALRTSGGRAVVLKEL